MEINWQQTWETLGFTAPLVGVVNQNRTYRSSPLL